MVQIYKKCFLGPMMFLERKKLFSKASDNLFIGTLYLITLTQLNANLGYQRQMLRSLFIR